MLHVLSAPTCFANAAPAMRRAMHWQAAEVATSKAGIAVQGKSGFLAAFHLGDREL